MSRNRLIGLFLAVAAFAGTTATTVTPAHAELPPVLSVACARGAMAATVEPADETTGILVVDGWIQPCAEMALGPELYVWSIRYYQAIAYPKFSTGFADAVAETPVHLRLPVGADVGACLTYGVAGSRIQCVVVRRTEAGLVAQPAPVDDPVFGVPERSRDENPASTTPVCGSCV